VDVSRGSAQDVLRARSGLCKKDDAVIYEEIHAREMIEYQKHFIRDAPENDKI